jgi:hypothetical protein
MDFAKRLNRLRAATANVARRCSEQKACLLAAAANASPLLYSSTSFLL